MSERIAEFDDLDDANRFRHMKGAGYEVVAGINFAWAVMPKIQYAANLGRPDEPPDFRYADQDREDDEE